MSKLISFQRYERDYSSDERMPTLVEFRPEPEERKPQQADTSLNMGRIDPHTDDTQEDALKPKIDYVERPWRLKLNPALNLEKKELKFFQQKFEAKGTVSSPLTDKHDVLIQHLPITLQVRKELIQATASMIAPRILKDKPSNLKLLETVYSIYDNLVAHINSGATKPQDKVILQSY